MDFKRCPKKWYWHWRKGLVPKSKVDDRLELGTWIHHALEQWYKVPKRTTELLIERFDDVADNSENANLGRLMLRAYGRHYRNDPGVKPLAVEIPLEFVFSDPDKGPIATHMLKPDLVYQDREGRIWLMEHKTAISIRTEHLVIDDQARPYGAMAERALKNAGVLSKKDALYGIMYNFLRKALPDNRELNEQGLYLNKNGTVSKRQPLPMFKRHPVRMSSRAKSATLHRLRDEALLLTVTRQSIVDKEIDPRWLPKTQHYTCPKFCQFFAMCTLEEEGADIKEMQRAAFTVANPYDYQDTTEEPESF